MNKDITLVIMAAGMGSRFGGLKQIEAMGPNGEFIIDYSVYDALKAGFTKIIFIIKKENFEIFKETIGKRVEDKIKVEYVFQEVSKIPLGFSINEERTKPLGTTQAILCCKDYVNEPFAIINADDFYGRDAYMQAAKYLKQVDINTNNYAMISYHVKNTITENGSVKRGVCEIKNDYLVDIIESSVEKKDNQIIASPLNNSEPFIISADRIVSMNLFLFTPTIFKYLEENLKEFLSENKDSMTAECLISDTIHHYIKNQEISIKAIETTSVWYGVTYKEDKESVVNAIKTLINNEIYPRKLWYDYE